MAGVFDGAADESVPPSGSIGGVDEVNRCHPRSRALLTIYPGVGHDSWTRTYAPAARFDARTGRPAAKGVNVYQWLLGDRRPRR